MPLVLQAIEAIQGHGAEREHPPERPGPVHEPEQEIEQRRQQNPTRRAQVWIVDGAGSLKPVDVAVGISDGTVTELVRGDLKEGQPVVIGQSRAPAPNRRLFGF